MESKNGLWIGTVNGAKQTVNVVGTYGHERNPVVRIEEGPDYGKAFAIVWDTGEVIKELNLC